MLHIAEFPDTDSINHEYWQLIVGERNLESPKRLDRLRVIRSYEINHFGPGLEVFEEGQQPGGPAMDCLVVGHSGSVDFDPRSSFSHLLLHRFRYDILPVVRLDSKHRLDDLSPSHFYYSLVFVSIGHFGRTTSLHNSLILNSYIEYLFKRAAMQNSRMGDDNGQDASMLTSFDLNTLEEMDPSRSRI